MILLIDNFFDEIYYLALKLYNSTLIILYKQY